MHERDLWRSRVCCHCDRYPCRQLRSLGCTYRRLYLALRSGPLTFKQLARYVSVRHLGPYKTGGLWTWMIDNGNGVYDLTPEILDAMSVVPVEPSTGTGDNPYIEPGPVVE